MPVSAPAPARRAAVAAAAIAFVAAPLLGGCGGGDDANTERRAAIVNAASTHMRAVVAEHAALPGVVIHVLDERSGLSWAGSTGVADRSSGRALSANATFRTASVTKVFTAAAILQLQARGKLSTADAIERHLSPQTVATLRAGGYDTTGISVDHLLTHRSGLPDHALSEPYWQAVLADPTHRWSRAEQLAVAMALGAPLFAPGTDYRYSDAGYLLLGEMIERSTSQGLGASFRELLQLPSLGLVATYQESVDPVPPAAGPRANQDLIAGIDDSMIDASTDLWGAGGLVSDGRDLALFVRALVNGRILGAGSLQAMMQVASDMAGAPLPTAYARGLARVQVDGTLCWGHDGFSGAFMLHCPSIGITVAGSINATEFVGAPGAMGVAAGFVRALSSID
ncbi:MAG: serine hydrolase domain-containing protein [Piscinibacter sp.]|jgi:D-alanyl-D-alanine carboxypeptidase